MSGAEEGMDRGADGGGLATVGWVGLATGGRGATKLRGRLLAAWGLMA